MEEVLWEEKHDSMKFKCEYVKGMEESSQD